MGYAVIVSSNDELLRVQLREDPVLSVRTLMGALDSAGRDQSVDDWSLAPWSAAARVHASQVCRFLLTPGGLLPRDGTGEPTTSGSWAPGMTRRAVSSTVAVVRTVETSRSVWWSYADSFPWVLSDAGCAELARQLAEMLTGRSDAARVGPFANAFNRAGGLSGSGSAEVFWVGNRVTAADGLSAVERERLS